MGAAAVLWAVVSCAASNLGHLGFCPKPVWFSLLPGLGRGRLAPFLSSAEAADATRVEAGAAIRLYGRQGVLNVHAHFHGAYPPSGWMSAPAFASPTPDFGSVDTLLRSRAQTAWCCSRTALKHRVFAL